MYFLLYLYQVPTREVLEQNKDMVMGKYSGRVCNFVCLLYTQWQKKTTEVIISFGTMEALAFLNNIWLHDFKNQTFQTNLIWT